MYKAVILLCVQALLQSISAQCIGDAYGLAPLSAPLIAPCSETAWCASPWSIPFGNGYGPGALAGSNGGGFVITSASPIASTGVFITSENRYEGTLTVSGAIPFMGAVALEGALSSIGDGAVTYGCDNGNVAMITEDIVPSLAFAGPIGYEGQVATYGYAAPLAYNGYNEPVAYGDYTRPVAYCCYTEPLIYDGYIMPTVYDCYTKPAQYECYNGPVAYDYYPGPLVYNGCVGPVAYEGYAGPIGYVSYGYASPWY